MFLNSKKIEKEVLYGKKKLDQDNNRAYLIDLSSRLSKTNFEAKGFYFGISNELMHTALRQFIIQRFLFTTLNISVLRALGRKDRLIKCNLPPKFRKKLQNEEAFKSETIYNQILWIFSLLYWYIRGIYSIFEIFFNLLTGKMPDSKFNYIFFHGLSVKNFPSNFKGSKTIINWILHKEDLNQCNLVYHDAKIDRKILLKSHSIYESALPFYVTPSFINIFKYVINSIKVSLISFLKIFSGEYGYALLLSEYPKLYLSQNAGKVNYAKNYYFQNSTSIFRPLWTYNAEKNGSSVILYYYSAHLYTFKSQEGKYFNELYNYRYLSWPKYYVWHNYHKKYLLKLLGNECEEKFKIVGPIWFESNNNFRLPENLGEKKIISIFDISVFKRTHFLSIGHPYDYYTPDILLKFHKHILEILSEFDTVVGVLKQKRSSAKNSNLRYGKEVNDLYYKNFVLDPDNDPYKLIEKSTVSVHIPFVSTAHVSISLGIPAIYYDPGGIIQRDDEGLAGIELAKSKDELKKWLTKHIKKYL